jgi:hypothetical protein
MRKIPIRILAIIAVLPIAVIAIGIAIIWNSYLLTNSLYVSLKRRGLVGRKPKRRYITQLKPPSSGDHLKIAK